MKMYQLVNSPASFRFTEEQKAIINEQLSSMQQDTDSEYPNLATFVTDLISQKMQLDSDMISMKSALETKESSDTEAVNNLKSKLANLEKENESLVTVVTEYQKSYKELEEEMKVLKDRPAVEIEKPVPVDLTENQILLDLNPGQKRILDVIASRRFERKNDKTQNTPAQQITALVFSRQTLFNWGGDYFTHLAMSEFKNAQ